MKYREGAFFNLTNEEKKEVETCLQVLRKVFDSKSISLTPTQIKSSQKLGDKSLAFVQDSINYMDLFPNLTPQHIDANIIKKEYESILLLREIEKMLSAITAELKDTKIAIGMDCIKRVNSYYKVMKLISENNGDMAISIYNDLHKRYPRTRKRKKETTKNK